MTWGGEEWQPVWIVDYLTTLYDLYVLCDTEWVLSHSVDVSSLQKTDRGLFSYGISVFVLMVLGKNGE